MSRRGACPSFSRPMLTGDGLLARLHPAGPLPLSAFDGLCRAAATFGNGILEVTQRGSLQVRGLRAETLAGFTTAVEALDFEAPEGVVVLAPPLSSTSLCLAASIRQALAAAGIAGRVAPKTTVIVDAGDGLALDLLDADIRLQACDAGLQVGLGAGPVTWIGAIEPAAAGEAIALLLETLASSGSSIRMRDLDGRAFRLAIRRLLRDASPPSPRTSIDAVGRHAGAHGVGLPFGSAEAGPLQALLAAAGRAGADRAWVAPGRALIFEPVSTAPAFVVEAAALGFVLDPEDPQRRVQACTGAPGCASGLQPVRALAAEIAQTAGPLLGSEIIHLSGCAKGCAHPGKAAITLVGAAEGFGLVLDGRADGTAVATLRTAEVLTKLPDLLEKRRRAPGAPAARGRGAARG